MTLDLYAAGKGRDFLIASVPDMVGLDGLGLREGVRVTVRNRYALGGPVLLRVEDTFSVAVGKDIARRIAVLEAGER